MTTDGPREIMGGRELVVKFKGCTMIDMASFVGVISVRLLKSSIIYQDAANWEFVTMQSSWKYPL